MSLSLLTYLNDYGSIGWQEDNTYTLALHNKGPIHACAFVNGLARARSCSQVNNVVNDAIEVEVGNHDHAINGL